MLSTARHGWPWMIIACLAFASAAAAASVSLELAAEAPRVGAPANPMIESKDVSELLDALISAGQSEPSVLWELTDPAASSPLDLLERPRMVVAFLSARDVIALWDEVTPD